MQATRTVQRYLVDVVGELVEPDEEITVDANIFDLGVDSLLLVDLKDRIQRDLDVRVKYSDFFTNYTISALARIIHEQIPGEASL